MTIDVGVTLCDVSSDLPICRRPYLSGKLEEIWEKAGLETTSYFWTGPLQVLWEAARQLYLEAGKDLTNITLLVEQKPFFSSKSRVTVKEKHRDEEKKDGDGDRKGPVTL